MDIEVEGLIEVVCTEFPEMRFVPYYSVGFPDSIQAREEREEGIERYPDDL